MHAARALRQRRRLRAGRRPRGIGARQAGLAFALVAFGLLGAILLTGAAVATVAIAGYAYFAKDLPDPRQALEALVFTQQTKVYDRTGAVLLATLGTDRRVPVTFDQIPGELVDATTAIEDHTFWDNPGFDPGGFVSAAIDTLNGKDRGGSTITQQLVRQRLLPASAFANGVYQRKVAEIIQSIRLTEAYPGGSGKQAIIEAYLNNNFYGNRSYGVAAAARSYFGKDLKDLTLAECALLAGIPQSPTRFDLVKNAAQEAYADAKGVQRTRLVVPMDSEIVIRRNFILDLMKTRSPLTAARYTDADYEAAKQEPVILAPQATDLWRAPQFAWQVRSELGQVLCGSSADTCEQIDTGGYRVITTLDYRMQRIVEKWVYAAAIIPNSRNPDRQLRDRAVPRSEWSWIKALRGHNIHNAAAGVVDYRTGEILAYAGSASYTGTGNKKFQPQFDVLSDGWRQPGSSIKPLGYLTGIDDKTMTAATMFMDVVTNFAATGGRAWYPTQADGLERGPVRLRNALQFSLNIPAIKAGFINGLDHQLQRTKDFGLSYPKGTIAVPSESIGTLVTHPIDMISAFGTIANGGVLMPHHTILKILDAGGTQVWPSARHRKGNAGRLEPGGLHHDRHPRREHGSTRQPLLGQVADHGRGHGVQGAAGRLQDGHDQRQPRRARVRLPGAALRPEAAGPRGRRLDGQLGQLAQRRQAVPGHLGTPLERHPVRRLQGHADRGLRPGEAQGPGDGDRRRVHRHASGIGDAEDRPGALPARHRPDEGVRHHHRRGHRPGKRPALAGRLRRAEGHQDLRRPVQGRTFVQALAGRRQVVAGACRAWRGRPRWAEEHANRLLLRRRVLPVRTFLGRRPRSDQDLSDRATTERLRPGRSGVALPFGHPRAADDPPGRRGWRRRLIPVAAGRCVHRLGGWRRGGRGVRRSIPS